MRDRQDLHWRHSGVYSGMTWSPGFSEVAAGADLDYDARALMAQDGGEDAFRVVARTGEFVGMADTGGLDFDHDLAGLGAFQVDLHHFQRFAGL